MSTQRKIYSKEKLSSNRVLRLESIGFVWRVMRLSVDAKVKDFQEIVAEVVDIDVEEEQGLGLQDGQALSCSRLRGHSDHPSSSSSYRDSSL